LNPRLRFELCMSAATMLLFPTKPYAFKHNFHWYFRWMCVFSKVN
jgi:hypothetical protein